MPDSPHRTTPTTADLLYDTFYSGAIGGSVVALFFLVIDVWQGRPLFTPSLIGSVLFAGAAADAVTSVRLDMVAYYSAVHFAVFGALGGTLAFAVREAELRSRHPAALMLLLFAILESAFVLVATIVLPGVIERLGAGPVAAANLLTAGAMAGFLLAEHRPDVWQRLRQAAHRP